VSAGDILELQISSNGIPTDMAAAEVLSGVEYY